jgi:choline dehydrogenase
MRLTVLSTEPKVVTCAWNESYLVITDNLSVAEGRVLMRVVHNVIQLLHARYLFNPPANSWTIAGVGVSPKSRGQLRLTGPNPLDPVQIEANMLSHPDDLKAAIASVELCREIGNSRPLKPYAKREVVPGNLKGAELENFVRDATITTWHQTCTAKMGRDAMSVVDANLKVYGIENLRIADGSIMPRVTTGNTMAPCVIIGERAGEILRAEHNL